MKRGFRKAQSSVIANVLIILLVVGLVAILGAVVMNFVKKGAGGISSAECFSLNMEIDKVVCDLNAGTVDVTVKRVRGAGELSAVRVMFDIDGGDSESFDMTDAIPLEGDTKTYRFSIGSDYSAEDNTLSTEPNQVRIAGRLLLESGDEELCNEIDSQAVSCSGELAVSCVDYTTNVTCSADDLCSWNVTASPPVCEDASD